MGDQLQDMDFNGLTHAAPTLPGSYYYDQEHHVRELDALWYRQWLYVCRSDAIAESGAWQTFTIGTQNILIVRDGDGTLRAFQNTCRHRGSILCEGSEGRFKSKLITCPYHQWAYAFDGRLVSTTSHSEAENFDKADYPLYSAAVMEWRGCVMVCPAGSDDPESFKSAFLRDNTRLDNWPLEDLVHVHTWTKTMDCNWKVFWENFNECLHCPNIHPELSELVPLFSRRIINPKDVPDWKETSEINDPKFQGGMREGATTWTDDGTPAGVVFEGLTDAERAAGHTYVVSLPSMFVAGHADYMRIVRLRPLGPEKTELQAEWFVTAETANAPEFEIRRITDFPILVMEQDATACALNQRGLHALGHQAGVLMPEEYYLHQFHNWVREGLGEA